MLEYEQLGYCRRCGDEIMLLQEDNICEECEDCEEKESCSGVSE